LPLADCAKVWNNSVEERKVIAKKSKSGALEIGDESIWNQIEETIRGSA